MSHALSIQRDLEKYSWNSPYIKAMMKTGRAACLLVSQINEAHIRLNVNMKSAFMPSEGTACFTSSSVCLLLPPTFFCQSIHGISDKKTLIRR